MSDTLRGQHTIQDSGNSSFPEPLSDHLPSKSKIKFVTLVSFIIAILLGIAIVIIVENNRLQNRQKTVSDITIRIADNIHDHLSRSLSATYALASILHQRNGLIENFEQLAVKMLGLYGGISALQLAPQGIISASVPLAGNEKAIGHNLLDDSKRNKEALLALKTRSLTLAGPFELVQGGQAVVGRLPVFIPASDGTEHFWGFTAVLIRIPELVDSAKMQKIVESGYHFELSRINPDTGLRDVFARSSESALRAPAHHTIQVPNGTWTLSVEPVKGWFSPLVISAELLLVLLFGSLTALMVNTFYKQPLVLQQMVNERTKLLSETNQKLMSEMEEHSRTETALRKSEARLNESQKVAHLGHYELDIASGIWTNSSELDKIFGIDAGFTRDIQGWQQIIHPDDREEMAAYLTRHILTDRLPFNKEYRICRISDQSVRWVHGLGDLGSDADNNLVNMFGTIQDITDRKLADENRNKLEQQMQHAQKLESLGVLAGGIAHDFNNILMAILGHAELALMRLSPASPARENLASIEEAAQRAADLSRQMLAYSGKGHFLLERIELGELVTEMMHMLEVSISKKVMLRLDLATDLPPVKVDATQIRQVLMNLVINASEAIGDNNGVIAIRTGTIQCDNSYLSGFWLNDELQEGLYVYIEVADTGCGMDSETIGKIFDPFFTTKFTGRGLGMAAVMGIVRGHLGAIKIYSEPDRGTTFKLLLPAAEGGADKKERQSTENQHWQGTGLILLVDDEEPIRNLGKEMLNILGFEVLTASDGIEALETFKKHSQEIKLVILDMTMPHMGGEETFRELRRIKPNVQVVISSGYNEHDVSQRFPDKGLAGFIQKPYTLSALSEVLRKTLFME